MTGHCWQIVCAFTGAVRVSENDNSNRSRRIRSFVRRQGRLTPGQKRAWDALWPVFGLDAAAAPLDLDALFGRASPTRVFEIGYGDGESLVALATEMPDADFLGAEIHEPGVGHCLLGIEANELTNVRLIAADAIDIMQSQLAAGSLQRINLYFPDPWPKKRHHKRRIVQDSFLALTARCLAEQGRLHIATDWAPYAEHIQEVFDGNDLFRLIEHRQHSGDQPLERPTTKFERRGLKLGHWIDDWIFERL